MQLSRERTSNRLDYAADTGEPREPGGRRRMKGGEGRRKERDGEMLVR
jgi:hypothetical protein